MMLKLTVGNFHVNNDSSRIIHGVHSDRVRKELVSIIEWRDFQKHAPVGIRVEIIANPILVDAHAGMIRPVSDRYEVSWVAIASAQRCSD
jgi:hypothetical protein